MIHGDRHIDSDSANPLLSNSAQVWDRLIESINPASLLVVIDSRLSARLRRNTTPEDIFQEALLHAWRDRSQCEWRGIRSFRSWLLSVIDHRISHLAARSLTQKRGGDVRTTPMSALGDGSSATASDFPGPAGSTTPSRIAIFKEQAAAMHAALDAVPDECREIVRLRLFEQLTLDEIATRQDMHVSAVRRRFGRGVEIYEAALRSALASRSRSETAPAPSPPTARP